MRRSIAPFVLGLGLTFAVPAWISAAQAAPAKAKKESDKAKKETKKADKKSEKKNDPGFAL
jgi:ribosomal protein L12E/L44/L45/RPP1/RPP2